MRTLRAAALTAMVVLTLTCACGSDPTHRGGTPSSTAPHLVTTAQADRLAVSRFLLYQGGGARVTARLPSAQGTLTLVADLNYRSHVGYGRISGAGAAFLLEWNSGTFLAWPTTGADGAPAVLPRSAPSARPLAPTTTTSDALLALLLQLGANRPDNAQLLRQGGARWLRATTVGTSRVDVIAGPRAAGSTAGSSAGSSTDGGSAVRYYIDARGNLLRVDAFLGGGGTRTTIELDRTAYRPVPVSPRLTG